MPRQLYLLAMLLVVAAGCTTTEKYDFRDQYRPAYSNTVSVDDLAMLLGDQNVTLLDVRLLEDFQSNPVLIPGASYSDPEQIEAWSSALPADSKVVVYCVKGKWVSQKVANYLSTKGHEVYSVQGGIEAWQKAASK